MSKKRHGQLRKGLSASVLIAGLLVFWGCSGDPGSTDSDPPSTPETSTAATSPSPSPSVTPTPTEDPAAYKPATPEAPAANVPIPMMPELAKEESQAGREAFIAYYFDVMNYTIEARDPNIMGAITVTGSRYLQNMMGVANAQGKEDYWPVGGALTLNEVQSSPGSNPNGLFSDLVFWDKAPYQYYSANGLELENAGGTGRVWTIQLYFSDIGWVVEEFIETTS